MPQSPRWLQYLFETVPAGTLQYGGTYKTRARVDAPESPKGYRIVEDLRSYAGTGIPVPTLRKFASGQWTPRARSIEKLANFYRRYQYGKMRESGFRPKDARRYRQSSPDVTRERLGKFNRTKREIYRRELQEDIQTGAPVPVRMIDIEYGMEHAYDIDDVEDWDQYITVEQ